MDLTEGTDTNGLKFHSVSGLSYLYGTEQSARLYRITTVEDTGFIYDLTQADSRLRAAASPAQSFDAGRLIIHLDGAPTTVQKSSPGETRLNVDGLHDVAYADTGITDVTVTTDRAAVVYGADVRHIVVTGADATIVSDGSAGTDTLVIDAVGPGAYILAAARDATVVGHLDNANIDGTGGTVTLDYSALVGVTLDPVAGIATDDTGNGDRFTAVAHVVAPGNDAGVLRLPAQDSTQTLSGLGDTYLGFGILALAVGANWSVADLTGLAPHGAVVLSDGASLTISGSPGSADIFVLDSATLSLSASLDPDATITFADSDAPSLLTLSGISGSTVLPNPLLALSAGDRIVLDDVTFPQSANAVFDPTAARLVIQDGTTSLFQFNHVTTASSGVGGFVVHDGTIDVACFAEGTQSATLSGPVSVESLRPGDRVLSAFGGTVPVSWTGHRHIRPHRHPVPDTLNPILIRAGALAPDIPNHDLWLSPDHAVYLDDLLVPARCLVNSATILQLPVRDITYWHVELPAHDVILAANTPCESYLDIGNRNAFTNSSAVALHPTFASADEAWRTLACAPQCRSGPALEAIRARLATRAADIPGLPLHAYVCC